MRWPRTREIWVCSVLLAAVLVWTGRYFVNPDGISYLDLSDDIRAARFGAAVNGHWSPGYPYLLALWLSPLAPGSQWESTAVHMLNGLLFLGSLGAFEFFIRELAKSQPDSGNLALPLRTAAGRFAAYMIFLWGALVLITVKTVTPDMLVALLGFLAAGLFVRIQSGRAGTGSYIAIGAVLGLAALSKSFMFPVALVLIAVSAFSARSAVRNNRAWLLSAAIFAMVTAPHVAALSIKSGKLSIGESSRLVYLLKVNGVPKYNGGEILGGDPRLIAFPTDKPNRTYPLWDEPVEFFRRIPATFDVYNQSAALKRNIQNLAGMSLKIFVPLMLVVGSRNTSARIRNKTLAAISAAVLTAYLALHSEPRLAGFWIALLTVSMLAGTTLEQGGVRARLGRGFSHVITVVSVISFVTYALNESMSTRIDRGFGAADLHGRVAQSLRQSGIQRGDRVALVGDESDIYWARLAGVQVAAQIPLVYAAKTYWALPVALRADLHHQFRTTGARAIVASWSPPPVNEPGWSRVPDTQFWILPIN